MLKSTNVYLAPLKERDSEKMYEWINNRELILFNSFYNPVSDKQHDEWFRNILDKKDLRIFGIRLIKTNELIGTCQLHSINNIDRNAELQIRIGATDKLGIGLGTEAVKLLVKFAFMDLNLIKVYLYVLSTNLRAIKAYEKAGFQNEGLLKKHCHIDGDYRDLVIMGIIKDEK